MYCILSVCKRIHELHADNTRTILKISTMCIYKPFVLYSRNFGNTRPMTLPLCTCSIADIDCLVLAYLPSFSQPVVTVHQVSRVTKIPQQGRGHRPIRAKNSILVGVFNYDISSLYTCCKNRAPMLQVNESCTVLEPSQYFNCLIQAFVGAASQKALSKLDKHRCSSNDRCVRSICTVPELTAMFTHHLSCTGTMCQMMTHLQELSHNDDLLQHFLTEMHARQEHVCEYFLSITDTDNPNIRDKQSLLACLNYLVEAIEQKT